jgi:hypothetical protein
LRDVALARGDGVLELAGGEIVQIEVSPVLSFREPDEFIGRRNIPPVDPPVAGFEERRDGFLKHFANRAGRRVGHA